MKTIHNFKQSLQYERNQAINADRFYMQVLGATKIRRFNTDSTEDMHFQKLDIDVEIELKEKVFRISEKFREKDFGDFYIEFYSMYPDVRGWMEVGIPDVIVYFTTEKVYWISHRSVKSFYQNILVPVIKNEWFEELYITGQTIKSKQIQIGNKNYLISIIQAHNKSWKTMGISVPFQWLEDAQVHFKCFDLQK